MYRTYTTFTNSHLEDFKGFDDIIGLQFAITEGSNAKRTLYIEVNFLVILPKLVLIHFERLFSVRNNDLLTGFSLTDFPKSFKGLQAVLGNMIRKVVYAFILV